MSKCFISYCHEDEDGKALAKFFVDFLEENGLEVFWDEKILPGKKWAEEIEKNLRSSNFFIVLISNISKKSSMVSREVKIALELLKKSHGKFSIIPIRTGCEAGLHIDWESHLEPLQYYSRKPGDSFKECGEAVLKSINEHNSNSPEVESLKFMINPVQIELETGTIKLDSSFYIERKTDDEVMEQIKKKGITALIQGTFQSGKSSLLKRVEAESRRLGQLVFLLDFQSLDTQDFKSIEILFRRIAYEIYEKFNLSTEPDTLWDTKRGTIRNLKNFIEKAILNETKSQVMILFDNIDRLVSCQYRDDFFSTLRDWHNMHDRGWERLSLIIAHYSNPLNWIGINRSPFNVGYRMQLDDFNPEQTLNLNIFHGSPLSKNEIQNLIDFTGGHPFLVRWALYKLALNGSSFSFLKDLSEDLYINEHIERYFFFIKKKKGLKDSLKQVLNKNSCDNNDHFGLLKRIGLVKGINNANVRMRCQLYLDYFSKNL